MIISNLKKKIAGLSIIFILAGAVIGLAGFGMAGFDLSEFEREGEPKWYQTIHVDEGQLWVGISIGKDRIITGFQP